jgi:uncharacterized tellurite resistance protein B-like protein
MLLSQLKKIFGKEPAVTGLLEKRDPLELATAALLIEMCRSDFSESEQEKEAVRHLLQRRFALNDAAVDQLIAEASARADAAVSLHEFTHRLNRELSEADKLALVEMLWRVSHADGHIDKHEEYLVLRIAGLLHISDRDRIRMKLKVVTGD